VTCRMQKQSKPNGLSSELSKSPKSSLVGLTCCWAATDRYQTQDGVNANKYLTVYRYHTHNMLFDIRRMACIDKR
jgi:hypothetical protein